MAEESELDARCITVEPARCQFELRLCSELSRLLGRKDSIGQVLPPMHKVRGSKGEGSRARRHGEFFSCSSRADRAACGRIVKWGECATREWPDRSPERSTPEEAPI